MRERKETWESVNKCSDRHSLFPDALYGNSYHLFLHHEGNVQKEKKTLDTQRTVQDDSSYTLHGKSE